MVIETFNVLKPNFRPKEDKEDATIKNTEPPPQLVLACQQIVDCLVESVLRMEESNFDMTCAKAADQVSILSILYFCRKGLGNFLSQNCIWAKFQPKLWTAIVDHIR
jgi:hypothetical protein